MPIRKLSVQLASQIAAGEVVERPASVVKELLENAVDAKATKIVCDIKKAGKNLIRVRDNGSGIPKDELSLALEEHATSKIATLEDLEAIVTLGFRGEALSSIVAVSKFTLTSKVHDSDKAYSVSASGINQDKTIYPAAHPDGTSVEVSELFYNIPARRRFLKADRTELYHIKEIFIKTALANPTISFTLNSDGKSLIFVKAVNADDDSAVSKRISELVGDDFTKKGVSVNFESEHLTVTGFLLPPPSSVADSATDVLYIFLNGRPISDKVITHAIKQAFIEVSDRKQPVIRTVLYLKVPADEVDVNVHPRKDEVRFHENRLVHDTLATAIIDALNKASDIFKSHKDFEDEYAYDERETQEALSHVNNDVYKNIDSNINCLNSNNLVTTESKSFDLEAFYKTTEKDDSQSLETEQSDSGYIEDLFVTPEFRCDNSADLNVSFKQGQNADGVFNAYQEHGTNYETQGANQESSTDLLSAYQQSSNASPFESSDSELLDLDEFVKGNANNILDGANHESYSNGKESDNGYSYAHSNSTLSIKTDNHVRDNNSNKNYLDDKFAGSNLKQNIKLRPSTSSSIKPNYSRVASAHEGRVAGESFSNANLNSSGVIHNSARPLSNTKKIDTSGFVEGDGELDSRSFTGVKSSYRNNKNSYAQGASFKSNVSDGSLYGASFDNAVKEHANCSVQNAVYTGTSHVSATGGESSLSYAAHSALYGQDGKSPSYNQDGKRSSYNQDSASVGFNNVNHAGSEDNLSFTNNANNLSQANYGIHGHANFSQDLSNAAQTASTVYISEREHGDAKSGSIKVPITFLSMPLPTVMFVKIDSRYFLINVKDLAVLLDAYSIKNDFIRKSIKPHKLAMPFTVKLNNAKIKELRSVMQIMLRLGFVFEIKGQSIVVSAICPSLRGSDLAHSLVVLIDKVIANKDELENGNCSLEMARSIASLKNVKETLLSKTNDLISRIYNLDFLNDLDKKSLIEINISDMAANLVEGL